MSTTDYERFLAKFKDNGEPDHPYAVSLERQQEAELRAAPVRAAPEQIANGGPLVAKLESVSEKAISKLDEIMSIPLDPESGHYAGVLRAQNAAANTALITQTRVDDGNLRRRQTDMLPKLLEIIAREEARLPPRAIPFDEMTSD